MKETARRLRIGGTAAETRCDLVWCVEFGLVREIRVLRMRMKLKEEIRNIKKKIKGTGQTGYPRVNP